VNRESRPFNAVGSGIGSILHALPNRLTDEERNRIIAEIASKVPVPTRAERSTGTPTEGEAMIEATQQEPIETTRGCRQMLSTTFRMMVPKPARSNGNLRGDRAALFEANRAATGVIS
jgi:hypothetical protein